MDVETIRHLLDANGVKFTTQRYCVMAFLTQNPGHPTAAEIFDGVNRLDPRSARATVYRNLRDLVEAGLVREVAVEGRSARFDVKGMRHHHFICDRCGEVEDMEWFNVPRPPANFLGDRMVPAILGDMQVVVRELRPQDLKFEFDELTQEEAILTAGLFASVIGKAHGRQMKPAIRSAWQRKLKRTYSKNLDAPSWLWNGVVDLVAAHEASYLRHCRTYALSTVKK